MENSFSVHGVMTCLGDALQEIIENGEIYNLSDACKIQNKPSTFNKCNVHQKRSEDEYHIQPKIKNCNFYLDPLNRNDKLMHEKFPDEKVKVNQI